MLRGTASAGHKRPFADVGRPLLTVGRTRRGPLRVGRLMIDRLTFRLPPSEKHASMDSDADGTVSWQEFHTAHERIFKAMDANKDGV